MRYDSVKNPPRSLDLDGFYMLLARLRGIHGPAGQLYDVAYAV